MNKKYESHDKLILPPQKRIKQLNKNQDCHDQVISLQKI